MAVIGVLYVMEQAAAGREWDMNRAAAVSDLASAEYAERECSSLRTARAIVAELIDAAGEMEAIAAMVESGDRSIPSLQQSRLRLLAALARCGGTP